MSEKRGENQKGHLGNESAASPQNGDEPLVTILIDAYPNRVQTGVATSVGQRKNQEDAAMVENDYIYVDTNKMIAILCDGMGGLSGGEIASKLCANTLYKDFRSSDVSENLDRFFKASIQKIDKIVASLKNKNEKPLKAGTTLASAVVIGDKLYWASVGDSHIYLIRNNEMIQINIDHTYGVELDEKVKKGLMAKQEADSHPKREALTSFIGMGGVKHIDLNAKPFQLINGDHIVICSDGLYRSLDKEEIKDVILNSQSSIRDTANDLVSRAIAKGKKNQDNTTVVLVKYTDSRDAGHNAINTKIVYHAEDATKSTSELPSTQTKENEKVEFDPINNEKKPKKIFPAIIVGIIVSLFAVVLVVSLFLIFTSDDKNHNETTNQEGKPKESEATITEPTISEPTTAQPTTIPEPTISEPTTPAPTATQPTTTPEPTISESTTVQPPTTPAPTTAQPTTTPAPTTPVPTTPQPITTPTQTPQNPPAPSSSYENNNVDGNGEEAEID